MLNVITARYGRRVGVSVLLALAVTLGFVALFAAHVATVGTPTAATASLIGIGVVVTLNLGLLGIVLVGNVAVELRRLTQTAEAVGRGEFDASASSDRGDEIGRLFDAFDDTRQSLRDAVAESERAKSEAEEAREEAEELSETLLDRAEEIGGAMERAADGDLSRQLSEESEVDAIERITTAYNEMTGGLSTTIEDIQTFAGDVEATSEEMAAEADDDLDTADLLNEISREVSHYLWLLEAHLQDQPQGQVWGGGQGQSPQH